MAHEVDDRRERQRLHEAKLAVLVQYLYQLVTLVFPVTEYKCADVCHNNTKHTTHSLVLLPLLLHYYYYYYYYYYCFTAITQDNLCSLARPVKNWRILLEQCFMACIPLVTATSAFWLSRKCQSSPQWHYQHRLCTIPLLLHSERQHHLFNNFKKVLCYNYYT